MRIAQLRWGLARGLSRRVRGVRGVHGLGNVVGHEEAKQAGQVRGLGH